MCAVISTTTRACAAALALLAAVPADAAQCRETTFESVPMTVCTADPASDDIRLWLRDARGTLYGTFSRLDAALAERGDRLVMAMNGGMYHPDRSPVGHYRDPQGEAQPLVTSDGPGNFGLLPNGVFCLTGDSAAVIQTGAFAAARPDCRFATQSGPMLVIGGRLHPRFLPDSDSRFLRNGVGVTAEGRVVMAISDAPVNFHRFARFFRDGLGASDALYLDGKVSRLYAPELGRFDPGLPIGPILGVVAQPD